MTDQPTLESPADSLQTELDAMRRELSEARQQILAAKRETLAAQYGIPQDLLPLLRAESAEQMAEDAATLAQALGRAAKPAPSAPQPRPISAAHAAPSDAVDISWLRDRLGGAPNPFGRGGISWE